jgi:hypothetical protein
MHAAPPMVDKTREPGSGTEAAEAPTESLKVSSVVEVSMVSKRVDPLVRYRDCKVTWSRVDRFRALSILASIYVPAATA